MPKNRYLLHALKLVVCSALIVGGCAPEHLGSNNVSSTDTISSPVPDFTITPAKSELVPSPTSSSEFQGEYNNHYAAIAPGEYLACQTYDPTGDFTFRLGLIDTVDGKVVTLLEGIPVSTLTTDGKYLVYGNENNRLYYFYDLTLDRFKAINGSIDLGFPEYDYPEISTSTLDIVFVQESQGLLVWSMDEMRPILDVKVFENINDLMLQRVYWSIDANAFAFYLRYAKGPKPIEGLYVMDRSCLESSEGCPLITNKLVDEPYGSAPVAWTPEGNLAIVDWAMNNGASIKIYDIPNKRSIGETISLDPSRGEIVSLFWSPLNNSIAVQQSKTNEILLLSTNGEIQNRIEGCSGQLLGWVIISGR